MSRLPLLASPLLLGFDDIERLIDRAGKSSAEGYPPYNIERLNPKPEHTSATGTPNGDGGGSNLALRITLAVAGFTREQLDIVIEDFQLVVRGKQDDDKARVYLHRGIAARQFTRSFVLADGLEVVAAHLNHGLLAIDLIRRKPEHRSQRIDITSGSYKP
jgi:HSP20 family molecular chaperone IbpA